MRAEKCRDRGRRERKRRDEIFPPCASPRDGKISIARERERDAWAREKGEREGEEKEKRDIAREAEAISPSRVRKKGESAERTGRGDVEREENARERETN